MILIVVIHCVGACSNSLLITSIWSTPSLRDSLSGLMVCALSSTDFAYGAGMALLVGSSIGQFPSEFMCQAQSFFIHALCAASILLLFLITAERYRLIIKNTPTTRELAKKGFVGVFLISVCFAALPLVGFGHYELQPSKVYCFARGGRGVALDDAYLVVSCAIIANTCIGMVVMYIIIWRSIKASHQKVSGLNVSEHTKEQNLKAQRGIVLQFITITALFVVFWSPCLIKFLFESVGQVVWEGPFADVAIGVGVALNSATNPLAYGLMNKKIGDAMIRTIRRLPCFGGNNRTSLNGGVGKASVLCSTENDPVTSVAGAAYDARDGAA